MALVTEVLRAPDLDAVRRLAADRPIADLQAIFPSLKDEVQRMMRTEPKRALDIGERAVVVAEIARDPELEARAAWMRGYGLVGILRAREAAADYERAAAIFRDLGNKLEEAEVAIGWVGALMFLGDYEKALALGERSLRVLRRRGRVAEAAKLDFNLGSIHDRMKGPVAAKRHFDRALKSAKQLGDPVMIRVIQMNRAHAFKSLGRWEQAESLYHWVRKAAHEAGETRLVGLAEGNLGHLELLRGEYGRAFKRLEAARALQLEDPYLLTYTLGDLSQLFLEMNSFQRANALGRQARCVALRHGIRFEVGRAATYQAIACLGLGEITQASTHLEDATRAFQLEGNPPPRFVGSLFWAELEARRGRLSSAARLLARAAEVFAKERLPLYEATAWVNRAAIELRRDRRESARTAITRARRLMRRVRSPWLQARIDHLAGRVAMDEQKMGVALRSFRKAVERVETSRGRIGIDELCIHFGANKAPIYTDLVETLLRRGGKSAVADAFEVVERSRSRALVDLLAGHLTGARNKADPGVARLMRRLETLRAELNSLSGFSARWDKGGSDESRPRCSAAEVRKREEEFTDVVHRLRAKDAPIGALTAGETATLAGVQRGLPAGTILVEYYVHPRGSMAFVVARDGARLVELRAGHKEIVDNMSRLRFQLEKWFYGKAYVEARQAVLRDALEHELRRLAERLWDPLGVSARRVIVVPHGPLHSLPFHALTGADGVPLAKRHVFSYLPSASVRRYLDEDHTATNSRRFADARILAVGAGDGSIPQVDQEVKRVRRLFRRGRTLRGRHATRERFVREARNADVVHVATHGVFRQDDPHFSALQLADGWMSLYDLYGLHLRAGLVCVSACNSGRNWVGAGDEIVGLVRGFLHAGARTLVVSLWPVQDDSTVRFMEIFYRHLRSHRPAEEALTAAMLELREEFPHPYHWAPFVLIGRGGPISHSLE